MSVDPSKIYLILAKVRVYSPDDYSYEEAKSALLSEILRGLPKEKTLSTDIYFVGYNHGRADCEEAVKGMFGER